LVESAIQGALSHIRKVWTGGKIIPLFTFYK
jgi:hypothetical protein